MKCGKCAGLALACVGWAALIAGLVLVHLNQPAGGYVVTVAQWVIATGLAFAVIGATETGFGALDRFFSEILARTRRDEARAEAAAPPPALDWRQAPVAAAPAIEPWAPPEPAPAAPRRPAAPPAAATPPSKPTAPPARPAAAPPPLRPAAAANRPSAAARPAPPATRPASPAARPPPAAPDPRRDFEETLARAAPAARRVAPLTLAEFETPDFAPSRPEASTLDWFPTPSPPANVDRPISRAAAPYELDADQPFFEEAEAA
ncbi:MAG: hypothetical protein JNK46_00225, partial [Methylobacteriaceae bacterium]|nr:hypothetical protein [Methylobacteriaceae bacterium]